MVKSSPRLTNDSSILDRCRIETASNATSSIPSVQIEGSPAILPTSPLPSFTGGDSYVCIQSIDIRWCTRIPLKIQSVDTASPLAVDALIDSGATGQFIDAEFVNRERFKT